MATFREDQFDPYAISGLRRAHQSVVPYRAVRHARQDESDLKEDKRRKLYRRVFFWTLVISFLLVALAQVL